MQSLDLERLLVIVPGTGALDIEPLSPGLCDETYRVMRAGRAFSLRLMGAGGHDFGLDRRWQARLQTEAAHQGFAPRVVHSDPVHGMLLADWVKGRSWPVEETSSAGNLRKIADLVHRLQALAAPQDFAMTPQDWIDRYSAATRTPSSRPADERRGAVAALPWTRICERPDATLRAAAAAAVEEVAQLPPAGAVVCHSDLHTMNVIERGESLILLDWEYAHVGAPLWDLAGWSANNDFPPKVRRDLLSAYLGAPAAAAERRHFELFCWLYDYVCLLWSDLYLSQFGSSEADAAGTSGAAGVVTVAGVAARATLLDARLRLPAH